MSSCVLSQDPYIYQDLRGHWHLLAHVYNTAPFATTGLNYISGHGFSEDGLHWSEASEPSAALSSLLCCRRPMSMCRLSCCDRSVVTAT